MEHLWWLLLITSELNILESLILGKYPSYSVVNTFMTEVPFKWKPGQWNGSLYDKDFLHERVKSDC